MFFIAYAFKGQVHVCAVRVKIVSHSSCRTSAIFRYFCPLLSIYVLHSSPIFILLTCSIPVKNRSQLIWISSVFKKGFNSGLAGQGITLSLVLYSYNDSASALGGIQESLPQFKNPLMARGYVRRIMHSTMYQKAPFCSPEMAQ